MLVGLERADDAGVYRLNDEQALVQSVDFFTPIVDDPYTFGRIAAVNAFSDIYAMGARPLTALNLAAFPVKKFSIEVLHRTLEGGLEVIRQAGAVLMGGHSIDDAEFKYGLSVTGVVHPDEVLTNRGVCVGDLLVLTKPLGTGIVSTAVKAGLASEEAQSAEIAIMTELNDRAAEVMRGFDVHACTDVTGFGLVGHALEMIEESPVGLRLFANRLPVLPEVEKYCTQGLLPGGLHRNRKFREPLVQVASDVESWRLDIAHDPQTSGGLLITVPTEQADRLVSQLQSAGVAGATIVAEAVASPAGQIQMVS